MADRGRLGKILEVFSMIRLAPQQECADRGDSSEGAPARSAVASEVTMKARAALKLCLLCSLVLAVGSCTGGTFVQYPVFPDRSCGTCLGPSR
jgi:hypothetical protein